MIRDLLDIIKIYSSNENIHHRKLIDEYNKSVLACENGATYVNISARKCNNFNYRSLNITWHGIYSIRSYKPVGLIPKNY